MAIYVGKTLKNVEKRWKIHQRDSQQERCKNRPLYQAMNKYGIDNFEVSILEEIPDTLANERERYWIELLGSFKNGYNVTLGGDGRAYADYDLIFALWNEGKNNQEIHNITGYDKTTIKNALENQVISIEERQKRVRQVIIHSIAMLDKNTQEVIRVFASLKEAYAFLNKQHSGHIASVCNGKRKTAYGYSWKYLK